jgi:hypothetical protein
LARILKQPDAEELIRVKFVDAVDQAQDDLSCLEMVLNDVWYMVLKELDQLKLNDGYERARRVGHKDTLPSICGEEPVSAKANLASGAVNIQS